MPPRILTLGIILCWLGMVAWLFFRDLWPGLRPGEPPAYTIMPSDEVPRSEQRVDTSPPMRWNVFRNGLLAYDLECRTRYLEKGDLHNQDDTFEMRTIVRIKQQPFQKAPERRLRSHIRISRDGELREIHSELHIALKNWEIRIDVEGPISDGELLPNWRIRIWPADEETPNRVFDRWSPYPSSPTREVEVPFKPMKFASRGIIVNPLQPPNRLDVLRPGQEWRMPFAGSLLVLDTLGSALHAFTEGQSLESLIEKMSRSLGALVEDAPILDARVALSPEPLPKPPHDPSPQSQGQSLAVPNIPLCWVIEAQDAAAHIKMRLWIQQSDGERKGLVLRQETLLVHEGQEEVWILQRE